MGLYNFKPQFVPYVLDGTKSHTIRAERKHPAKVGEMLHLYTGLRQKGTRLLMRVPCVNVEPILIEMYEFKGLGSEILSGPRILVDGQQLDQEELHTLAWRDGFRCQDSPFPDARAGSFPQMMQFWRGRLPFHGHIIHWDPKLRIDA